MFSGSKLQYLTENKETIYPLLNENGKQLRNTVNEFCSANRICARMIGIGSTARMIFTDKPIRSRRERDRYEVDNTLQKLFYSHLRFEEAVHVGSNGIIFLSTSHKKEHIEQVIKSIIGSLEFLNKYL